MSKSENVPPVIILPFPGVYDPFPGSEITSVESILSTSSFSLSSKFLSSVAARLSDVVLVSAALAAPIVKIISNNSTKIAFLNPIISQIIIVYMGLFLFKKVFKS